MDGKLTDEHMDILSTIATGRQVFVNYGRQDQDRIGNLINAGLVELVHGARRIDDRVTLTAAGRDALGGEG